MPLSFFLVALLGSAEATPPAPITITGHPWAPFISPMGEPYRAHTPTDDTLADWFQRADRNHDGFLTADEMEADAERFFGRLDSDRDGEIGPDELAAYEYEVAPEIQVMSKTRPVAGHPAPTGSGAAAGGDDEDDSDHAALEHRRRARADEVDASLGLAGSLQGAARYSLLNMPEPVAAADADFNRSVTRTEFRQAAIDRFQLLDATHQGRLTLAELEALPHAPDPEKRRRKRDSNAHDMRIGNPLPPGP